MQTRKDDEVQTFEPLGSEEEMIDKVMEANQKMQSGQIDSFVIGQYPENGKIVCINGLIFEVQQTTKSGNIILQPKGKETPES